MILGDLLISDADGQPPLKLMKAMAIIAEYLHPTFDWYYEDGVSLDSCILVSSVVREFLFRIGFRDAEARSVSFYIERRNPHVPPKALQIGKPGEPDRNGKWNGHMIAILPQTGWLFDCTLYQARRPHWDFLPGMIAAPVHNLNAMMEGHKIITAFASTLGDDVVQGTWIDTPENKRWRTAPDIIKGGKRERHRKAVVERLVYHFHGAQEGDEHDGQD